MMCQHYACVAYRQISHWKGTGKGKKEPAIAVVWRVMTEELAQSGGYLHSSQCGQCRTLNPVGL